MGSVRRIAVTGGGGQIAYSLLFRLLSGEVFGPNTPLDLRVFDLSAMQSVLDGVRMELEDCASPRLQALTVTSDLETAFADVELALLIGSKPRREGMERKDLLLENGQIFVEQGKVLGHVAHRQAQVIVVGNPCNTNCLIAQHYARGLSPHRFFAMTRLDQNRAVSLAAHRARVPIREVEDLVVWGNHSSTQVPDLYHARWMQQPLLSRIEDAQWAEREYVEQLQQRGAAIIRARGKSSAGSAANALVEMIQDLEGLSEKSVFSCAMTSTPNPYGIEEGLIFSFPCTRDAHGEIQIVPGWSWNHVLETKIRVSERELIEERNCIAAML